jgi:hypothetical protein
MLMLSVIINVCMSGWEGGKGDVMGPGEGAKNGAVDLRMEPARAEVRFLLKRAIIPKKTVIFLLINTTHAIHIVYMLVRLCTYKYFLSSGG